MIIKTYVEIEIEVHFNAIKGEPETRDCPGSNDEIEIEDITIISSKFPKVPPISIVDFFSSKDLTKLEDECMENVRCNEADQDFDEPNETLS